MSYPTFEVLEKTIILLGGYEKKVTGDRPFRVIEEAKLREAAQQDSEAVAFAFYGGKWVAAA